MRTKAGASPVPDVTVDHNLEPSLLAHFTQEGLLRLFTC
jgi:hypothetical protein